MQHWGTSATTGPGHTTISTNHFMVNTFDCTLEGITLSHVHKLPLESEGNLHAEIAEILQHKPKDAENARCLGQACENGRPAMC